jgi:hypothetical protein
MVRLFDPVGAVAAGCEQASEPVVDEVTEPRAILRVVSMTPLIASVGPVEAPFVSK